MSAGSLWLEFCGLCANPLYAPRSEGFACCCPFILNYTWLLLPSWISPVSPCPPWKSFLPTLREFPGSLDDWDSAVSLLRAPVRSLAGELGSHRLRGKAKKRKGCVQLSHCLFKQHSPPRPSHVPPYPHLLKAVLESCVGMWSSASSVSSHPFPIL